jgi:serine/threonine-protein kinase
VASNSATPPPIPRERVAGKYELLDVAGRGGMATVWRAHQHGPGRFRRSVAVKKLYPHLAEQPMYREMFLEEARIGAVLSDPNIARVFDFLAYKDEHYLVMEWIEGIDLFTYIDYVTNHTERDTEWEPMVAVIIGMLRGLAAAHERKNESGDGQPIVHRDVTPHNVLIGVDGTARLIDFGLGLASDREGEKTDPGIAKGKLSYLAPEVVRGSRPTPAADQFAAGAVLWEALAGRRLFPMGNQYNTMKELAEARYTPLPQVRDDLPDELYEVTHRALSLDIEDRFPSVREMANRLSGILGASGAKDTYARLSRTVKHARADLGLGRRSQRDGAETPVPELEESGIIELDEGDIEPAGLLHRLLGQLKR